MRENYLKMQDHYVYMQDNHVHVDKQDTNQIGKPDLYVGQITY